MERTDYNSIYTEKYHSRSVDILKFWLMPFVMLVFFGLPTAAGSYMQLFSNFAAPAFFILSGFFILTPDDTVRRAKLNSAVKRSFKFFLVLFAVYLAINLTYLLYVSTNNDWVREIIRKRTAFDFIVLNVWPFPIGGSIWFIHSLFYADIILLIADKLGLLKKASVFIPVFILLVFIMLFSGEFAKISGFPYFEYNYIPAGGITRALPYMLLGMIIRRYANSILNVNRKVFPVFFLIGLLLAALEVYLLTRFKLLVYTGHTVGFCIMAVSVCCFALSKTDCRDSFLSSHGNNYAKRIYAFSQPVYFVIIVLLSSIVTKKYWVAAKAFSGVTTFLICLLISYLIGLVKFAIIDIKKNNKQ